MTLAPAICGNQQPDNSIFYNVSIMCARKTSCEGLPTGMKDKCGINSGGYDVQLPPKTELGIVSIVTQLFGCYGHAVQLECLKEIIVFNGSMITELGILSIATLMLQSCSSTRVCMFVRIVSL